MQGIDSGLFWLILEAKANIQIAARGENINIDVEAVKRLDHQLSLERVHSDFLELIQRFRLI